MRGQCARPLELKACVKTDCLYGCDYSNEEICDEETISDVYDGHGCRWNGKRRAYADYVR